MRVARPVPDPPVLLTRVADAVGPAGRLALPPQPHALALCHVQAADPAIAVRGGGHARQRRPGPRQHQPSLTDGPPLGESHAGKCKGFVINQ